MKVAGQQVNILLVEDEPAHAELIRRAFESDDNSRLNIVGSLRQARDFLTQSKPDLILSDLRLPDGEGTELLQQLDGEVNCPVVIMTSFGDQDVAVHTIKAGAADYIVKTEATLAEMPRAADRVLREWSLILERKRSLENQQRLMAILEATPDLIATADMDGFLTYMNQPGRELLGIGADEDLTQIRLTDCHTEEDARLILSEGIPTAIRDGVWKYETTFVTRHQDEIPTSQVLISHKNEQGNIGFFSTIVRDIRSVKEAEAKIEYLALFDSLTGLPNRNELLKRLEVEIGRTKRQHTNGALIFIDLDNFKNINDSLGHPVGDCVLEEIGRRLQTVVRGEDTIARLGGDEFVVVLAGLSPEAIEALNKARDIAEKLREQIAGRIEVRGHSLQITASVGIAMFSDGCQDAHELLRLGDTAMYHAKSEGKNNLQVFREGMDEHFSRHLSMENELRVAIQKQQFILHFQPKIALNDEQHLIGAEALIRWQHPEKGLLLPGEFLDVLEASCLIMEVGNLVMEAAFRQLALWLEKGLWDPAHRISINVSPNQFRDERFVGRVIYLLETIHVPASCIDIEVTENIVISNVEEAIGKMQSLSDLGISFSLDDFGTGYSSLSYLKRLPVSTLKIDRSFVRDITTDSNDEALVSTILAMSEHLGMQAVAEGVETEAQLKILQTNHCRFYQGFYFNRPLPVGAFEQVLVDLQPRA